MIRKAIDRGVLYINYSHSLKAIIYCTVVIYSAKSRIIKTIILLLQDTMRVVCTGL